MLILPERCVGVLLVDQRMRWICEFALISLRCVNTGAHVKYKHYWKYGVRTLRNGGDGLKHEKHKSKEGEKNLYVGDKRLIQDRQA